MPPQFELVSCRGPLAPIAAPSLDEMTFALEKCEKFLKSSGGMHRRWLGAPCPEEVGYIPNALTLKARLCCNAHIGRFLPISGALNSAANSRHYVKILAEKNVALVEESGPAKELFLLILFVRQQDMN